MSRNVRQKKPATPSTVSKRRGSDTSSSFDLSDDDGYSAVEDISDSEDDDEEDVNAVEEELILTEAVPRPAEAPRPQPRSDEEGEEEQDEEEEEEEEEEDDDDEDDNHFGDGDADESTSWAGIVSEVDGSQVSDFYHEPNSFASDAAVERHVRFDVPSSDSDSTETEEDDHGDLFPDIFVSQNSLDPAFRREIEHDPDESSGSGSFWDFNGQYEEQQDSDAEEVVRELSDEETPTATPRLSQTATGPASFTPAFEESHELDGYESEFGLIRAMLER